MLKRCRGKRGGVRALWTLALVTVALCGFSALTGGNLAHASTGEGPLKAVYFKLGGDAPAKRKKAVVAAIRAALNAAGRTPVANAATLDDTITLLGCDAKKASCVRRVVTEIGADEVVGGTLTVAKESAFDTAPDGDPRGEKKKKKKKKKDPDLRLELVVANKTGRVLHRESTRLSGPRAAGKALGPAVDPIVERAIEHSHGKITVKSTPTGADVIIDGDHKGTTPVEVELMVGGHSLDVIGGANERSRSINVTFKGGDLMVDLTTDDTAVDDEDPLALDDEVGDLAEPPPPRDLGDDGSRKGAFAFDLKRLSMPTIITGAAGGGLLVLGIVLGSATLATRGSYNRRTDALTRPLFERDLDELSALGRMGRRGKGMAISADIFFALGGTAVIVAGVMAYLNMKKPTDGSGGDLPTLRLGSVEARADVGWIAGAPGVGMELRW